MMPTSRQLRGYIFYHLRLRIAAPLTRLPYLTRFSQPAFLWELVFACFCILTLVPWAPRPWRPPCNNSWALVLHNDFMSNSVFGVDTVFTFGPYGFLYYGAIPTTYIYTLLGWLVISGGYTASVLAVVREASMPYWAKLLLALGMTVCAASLDVVDGQVFSLAAFALAAGTVCRPGTLRQDILITCALALCTVTKLSWAITIAPMVFAVCIADLLSGNRRWIKGPTFLMMLILLWACAGQPFSSLPTFIQRSLEITTGYAQSMQLTAPWSSLSPYVYILITITVITLSLFGTWRTATNGHFTLFYALICFICFVVFKAGFVRQDHHEIVAATFLVTLAALMFALCSSSVRSARPILVVLSVSLVILFSAFFRNMTNPYFRPRLSETLLLRGLRDVSMILTGHLSPLGMITDDLAATGATRLPNIPEAGTVDVYPWGAVDALYAKGATVRHRPIFESYSAYTPALARINRDFLISTMRPRTILFAVMALDGRFPAMEDGLSWPELLTRYELRATGDPFITLEARQSPGFAKYTLLSEDPITPYIPYTLPGAGPIWISIDIPLGPVGRLLSAAYRPAILLLAVRFADGVVETYRLIPGVARAGFLLSPAIVTTDQWEAFHKSPDSSTLMNRQVIQIAIAGEPGFDRDYDFQNASLQVSRLTIDSAVQE